MRTALHSYVPDCPAQAELRTAFLDRLDADPGSTRREAGPSHLTASALVLSRSLGSVLLVLHRRVGLWLQPGGHVDAGDASLACAALREAVEETGAAGLELVSDVPVRLDRHRAPCGVDEHLDVQFLVLAPDDAPIAVSEESLDVAWWPVDALPSLAPPGLPALVSAGVKAARAAVRAA